MPGPAVISTGPSGEAMALFWFSLAFSKSKPSDATYGSAASSSSRPAPLLTEKNGGGVEDSGAPAADAFPPVVFDCAPAALNPPVVSDRVELYDEATAALKSTESAARRGSSRCGAGLALSYKGILITPEGFV